MISGVLASLSQLAKTHDTGGVEFWHQPDRAGWLYKQGDVISTWRRRWFVLKDGRLFWFMNENVTPESKTRGVIDLRNCLSVASSIEKTNKEGSFEITCDGETKFFIADDEDIKDQWLSAIGNCIVRASFAISDHVSYY